MRTNGWFRWPVIATLLVVASVTTAPGAGEQPEHQLFEAFVRHNLAQLQNGQIYISRPHVRPVNDWTDGKVIQSHIESTALEAFAQDTPAGDVILINRRTENLLGAYKGFSGLIENSTINEDEVIKLWSKALASDADCDISYVRDYLAIVSVASDQDAQACVEETVYWFRGLRQSFADYAGVLTSNATRLADEQFAVALRDCAPLGWLDNGVRNCIIRRLSTEPDTEAGPPKRR